MPSLFQYFSSPLIRYSFIIFTYAIATLFAIVDITLTLYVLLFAGFSIRFFRCYAFALIIFRCHVFRQIFFLFFL